MILGGKAVPQETIALPVAGGGPGLVAACAAACANGLKLLGGVGDPAIDVAPDEGDVLPTMLIGEGADDEWPLLVVVLELGWWLWWLKEEKKSLLRVGEET